MNRTWLPSRLRARLEIALWRHGWAWLLAACAGAGALALHAAVLLPGRAALQAAQQALAHEQQLALRPPPPPAAAPTGAQRLAAVQALLRQSPEAGELVRAMDKLAQAGQITLAQADYQYQVNSTTQAMQVQITQPVKAGYPQLRGYIEAVLRALPNATLDQIAAKRDNVGQAQLQARLKWSLWLQDARAVPPNPAAPLSTQPTTLPATPPAPPAARPGTPPAREARP